ncbi:conserved hypothetical protein [Candidatus Protochlamydia naegleriophila]|uniref:Uncharacterized protein n=1 Tax=Candidatus Protochlamydia naegleriophila TaxID=389348 RepID=A0A0U5JGY5_9BACT|nr:hypothetical protein [Candidatus Protochlamydia naegleriophila]CUI17679.1 conserved hypothetical protein [Candidatus Protochlamydia naegleriophila]
MTIDTNPQWSNRSDSFPIDEKLSPLPKPDAAKKSEPIDEGASIISSAEEYGTTHSLDQPFLTAPGELLFRKLPIKKDIENTFHAVDEILHESLSLLHTKIPIAKQAKQGPEASLHDSNQDSLSTFLSTLSKALMQLRQTQRDIELLEASDRRALTQALLNLSEIHEPSLLGLMGKIDLLTQLKELRANGMELISTGQRIILGRRPDLMLRLLQQGIIPSSAGGGPFDGMAAKAIAERLKPYDNPLFAPLAQTIPSGWEELSGAEMDGVIDQVQASIDADLRHVPFLQPVIFTPLITLTMAGLSFPTVFEQPSLLQLLDLRNQLTFLKSNNFELLSSGPGLVLGHHPHIMMQLLTLGITPPIIEDGPNAGMAKRQAEVKEGPYGNPLYAAMAQSLPSGWEELSERELDLIIAQIDAKLDRFLTSNGPSLTRIESTWGRKRAKDFQPLISASLNALLFPSVTPPILSNWIENLEAEEANDSGTDTQRLKNETQHFQTTPGISRGWIRPNQMLDLLLIKVVIHQALGFAMFYQTNPLLNPFDFGLQMLNRWIVADLASLMVNDLDEYAKADALERDLIKQSLISFALILSLAHAQQTAPSNSTVRQVLKAIAAKSENSDHALYANAADILVEGCQSDDPNKSIRQFIRALTAKIEQDDDQLEKLRLLQKLLLEIMKKLMQLPSIAGIEPIEANPETTDDSAFFLQG